MFGDELRGASGRTPESLKHRGENAHRKVEGPLSLQPRNASHDLRPEFLRCATAHSQKGRLFVITCQQDFVCDNNDRMGRPRKLVAVREIPFVAGSLCLDLANTTGARASAAPRERLTSYHDLLVWSERAGVLDPKAARRLRAAAVDREDDATRVLTRVRTLREELYQLFLRIAEGRHVNATQVARLGRRWRAARSRQELVAGEGKFELRLVASADDVDLMLWPIVMSAVELLTSDRVGLVRRCAECDWLFLDESKNGSRRWCKLTCGNRARSRERYERTRLAISNLSIPRD